MTDHHPARPFWADAQLCKLPKRWEAQLVAEWRKLCNQSRGGADQWIKRRLGELEAAYRAGLNPSMDDTAICALAEAEARDYRNHVHTLEGKIRHAWGHMAPAKLRTYTTRRTAALCMRLMDGRGMADLWPDAPGMTDAGRIERLKAPEFWRRAFRKTHARTLEQCAIAMGLVHAQEDAYCSKESRKLWQQRQAANAHMLANTVAVNDHGDEKTLQELAARSIANPTIRRGELMTRVAGFEACADALQHVKRWAVLTCPSRMHKYTRDHKGNVVPNPKYDGTQPREAQDYLAGQWRKLLAWWERQGLRMYGFRTTEPHADGCPHWNLLAFFAPLTERVFMQKQCKIPVPAVPVFDAGLRAYFLDNDSPSEAGAKERRVCIKAIDPEKGSAAGYIAKYISKGIDGHGMDVDLLGLPIDEAAPAVVAWARVWGIRQFQQIGGAPVTVWRELRRLHPDNAGDEADTPEALRATLAAVNLQLIEPGEKKSVAWMRYTQAQGGPTCKRKGHRVGLLRVLGEGRNRYGEPQAAKVLGVVASGRVAAPVPQHMAHLPNAGGFTRPILLTVESERASWVVVPKRDALDAFEEQCKRMAAKLDELDKRDAHKFAMAVQRQEVLQVLGEARHPWTRVNNFTAQSFTPTLDTLDRRTPANPLAPLRVHRRKLGRFYQWAGGPGGQSEGVEGENSGRVGAH